MQTVCPHCDKKKPKQHIRFCPKNPSRVVGPGRTKKATETPRLSDMQPNQDALDTPIDPTFNVLPDTRPIESMPDLTLEDVPEPPSPPPQAPIDYKPITDVLVKTACNLIDKAIANELPNPLPPGCPNPPQPIGADEHDALSAAAAPVVAKYLPQLENKPEIVLLIVAAGVFAPRFLAARKLRAWVDDQRRMGATAPKAAASRIQGEEDLMRIGDASLAAMARVPT